MTFTIDQLNHGCKIVIYEYIQDIMKEKVAERITRTLKNKIYKSMISVSKNMFINRLTDINNEYNNIYHSTINMKLPDVKSKTYIKSYSENMKTILNLKLMIMWICQSIKTCFAKSYALNWTEEVFVAKRVKNTVP